MYKRQDIAGQKPKAPHIKKKPAVHNAIVVLDGPFIFNPNYMLLK